MKINTIKIGSKTYPIICDLNVLEAIQEEYESINAFERDLLGVKLVKDADGRQMFEADGSLKMELVEPSVKAIRIALVSMINEGLAYQAYQKGSAFEEVDGRELIAACDVAYTVLAKKLHEEYKRCFQTKKL